MLVRIVKNWDVPALRRQTPALSMMWDGIRFTEEPVNACDYVLVLNHARTSFRVECSPDNVWVLLQEPPTEAYYSLHRGLRCCSKVFTQDMTRRGARYVHSQPALPWHVNKTYDELVKERPPEKTSKLSWITSNLSHLRGHRERLAFLERLRAKTPFDLFGRGFQPIGDKWNGIAPYRYSLAVENFSGHYYWSEKLADCFLAWTMPIYFGCTNLAEFFPPESFISIDIREPDAVDRVREAIETDLWLKRRDAIAEARRLVLDHYQLFPYISAKIRAFATQRSSATPRTVTVGPWPDTHERIRRRLRRSVGGLLLRRLNLLSEY